MHRALPLSVYSSTASFCMRRQLFGFIHKLHNRLYRMLTLPLPNTENTRKVISIIGTTGVGKSQLSIELAKKFNGEIINADSMQMYLGLDNITNKHPIEERFGVEHHVMNHVDWEEQYYIHRFKKECQNAMEDCWRRSKLPIIVGGTHYYLQSVLFDNKTIGSNDEVFAEKERDHGSREDDDTNKNKLSEEQLKLLNNENGDLIFNELKKVDPVIAAKFHPNDTRRVRRALEVFYVTGERASDVYERQRKNTADKGTSLKYDSLFFWIFSQEKELESRLDTRVDKMMHGGGVQELLDLFKFYLVEKEKGTESVEKMDNGVWQVIGFKEFLPYLMATGGVEELEKVVHMPEGSAKHDKIESLINDDAAFKACCDEMKLKTRRYARKQVKWIKKLLGPQLAEEAQRGLVKYGEMFVLDATDLNHWETNVNSRGCEIAKEFIDKGYVTKSIHAQVPASLDGLTLIESNGDAKSSMNKTENWVHYQCDVCTDKESGKPMVYVGEQWSIHLKSKKHRYNLDRGKRKREYEAWLASKK